MQFPQPQPRAAGARLELQLDFYSYIYQSRRIELNFKKSYSYSYYTWLNSFKLSCCFGVQGGSNGGVDRTTVRHGTYGLVERQPLHVSFRT
jgi:hypothetical protein